MATDEQRSMTADEALSRAIEYADGRRSDLWNTAVGMSDAGPERIAALAASELADGGKALAWAAVSIALRDRENRNGD